jgi:spermidine synthase
MALPLSLIFFLSGAAGVLFETVWFRVMGLTLGNSVWAANIVLASFMAGLAAGNAIAARHGDRALRPLRLYAAIELLVGISGAAVVVLVPAVSPLLSRFLAGVAAHGWLLNVVRLAVASTVLIVPATGMGLTLPLIARAATQFDANFGRVLGRLYGWNTLGGMAGAWAGEWWLIESLGLRGAGAVAAALNLGAAGAALLLARRGGSAMPAKPPAKLDRPADGRSTRLLAAAFLSGATLLALEAVWFRFLLLFVFGTSFIFAAMLATVLLGIGAGGALAGLWLGRDRRAHRFAPMVALAAGLSVEVCYALFDPKVGTLAYTTDNTAGALSLFARLMLPASFASGVLFALLGAAEREECGEAAEAAGKLTLANTTGAVVGVLLAGFVLVPRIGIEKLLFASMLSYGSIAGLTSFPAGPDRRPRRALIAASGIFLVAAALYPFGLLKRHFVPLVLERYDSPKPELMVMREGLTETVMYLRNSFEGEPLYYRLMTNGHSMSATTYRGRRYMKLYAYWALAVNPSARDALLISYGIGNTAKALTDARQLSSIDVVDVSRDVLQLGSVVYPDTSPPLADPRVHVHVEDGRFFLQTTDRRFDLITAEPPPPRGAGITNLYSREYFGLVHDRLREGGVVTYWLPVNLLWLSETKAIIRAFCDVFPDCSLWTGAGLQWMLAGTRGAHGPVPEDRFSAQWHDPAVAPELAALGFERPESLGATFLADARTLARWTDDALPLDDDHPGRILARYPPDGEYGDPAYRSWMDARAARGRFETSDFIRDLWPAALRQRTVEFFGPQAVWNDLCVGGRSNTMQTLHMVLTRSSLRTLPLLSWVSHTWRSERVSARPRIAERA